MITITNNNIYCGDFSLSDCSDLHKIEKVHIKDIVHFLSEEVEFGESVTFKRLFDIIANNLEKFNEIFYSALGGHPIEPFLQEIENIPTESVESEYLEIHWFSEQYENDLTIIPSLHGLSTTTEDSYAMDFVSLNNIKDYIVKLNKRVKIFDFNKMKEKMKDDDSDVDVKSMTLELGNKSFTLFDIFNAILYEISFHGGPQDKKERFESLEETIEEAEEDLKSVDESKKSISFEEMIEKLESKDKYLVKYNELRDRVDKSRINNKKNLKKLKNCLIEKLKIYDIIENSDKNLEQYYKKLTDIEYNMQLLYGEEEEITKHIFWFTPKCTCPKIDNLEIYPSKTPIFDDKCPIHGK